MSKVLQLVSHPSELVAVIQLLGFRKSQFPYDLKFASKSLQKCDEYLDLTSRSFAAVIKELHPELRVAVIVFYLVLRALDTVEDDMLIDPEIKIPLLRTFHEKLATKDWTFHGCSPTEKDRACLEGFDNILAEFHKLKPAYQDIIVKITRKMGNGMADYISDEKFNTEGVATVKDYDLYCYYVAGLVGEGLTDLMVLARFADASVKDNDYALSNLMGLFLQKVNITRDYKEDMVDGRLFYPREIWSQYSEKLSDFQTDLDAGVACINHMVLNALGHATDVLTYLLLIREATCFNFCAIPQVMAMATLAEIYNNPKVLQGNVKIRKGTTCKLILELRTLPGVVRIFRHYVKVINHKLDVRDPNYLKIGLKLGEIEQFCESMYPTPGLVPAGAARVQKPINVNIANRGNFDTDGERFIQQEKFKCYTSIAVASVLVAAIAFHLFYSPN